MTLSINIVITGKLRIDCLFLNTKFFLSIFNNYIIINIIYRNWSIAVWNTPAGEPTGKFLKAGSKLQVISYTLRDTGVWLQVGENQWLDANYLI